MILTINSNKQEIRNIYIADKYSISVVLKASFVKKKKEKHRLATLFLALGPANTKFYSQNLKLSDPQ